jgi:SpoVK/Ycf46/Vps4 family AAA+-type ATPase
VQFVVRRKDTKNGASALVKEVTPFLISEETYPSDVWRRRYDRLVGLDWVKEQVLTCLHALFSDTLVAMWQQKHHSGVPAETFLEEPPYPVFVFEGPPGLGKTELARAIGDPLARALGSEVLAYSVSLQLRGEGLVGQLSQNICKVMEFGRLRHAERGVPVLLLVDEADAIGHDRNTKEQHHEDSAGVSTLLEQIDLLRTTSGVALIFTTNRYLVLDEALRKRASAHWVRFPSPSFDTRFSLLRRLLGALLAPAELQSLARATEGLAPRDIVQLRYIALIEAISRNSPLTLRLLIQAATRLREAASAGSQRKQKGRHNGKAHRQRRLREPAVSGNGYRATYQLAACDCQRTA